ncbi:unnamed protein product [Closterium sp. Yama58-4]|nr:unnamed protein product [Closterium sp. Yama58-4]
MMGIRSLKNLLGSDGSTLQELRQLCIYTLSDEFTRLPSAITTLQHLTSLQVHARKLSSLPKELGALSRLRHLDLPDCSSLTRLPASLSELSCLVDLEISSSSVRSLPPGLSQLRRLKSLNLRNCRQLVVLPDEIQDRLPMLDFLDTKGCGGPPHISELLLDLLLGNYVGDLIE